MDETYGQKAKPQEMLSDETRATQAPDDLEQEKKELEATIEKHMAELQEIAGIFGIDANNFSDEDDQQFAKEQLKRHELLNHYYEKHNIKGGNWDKSPKTTFIFGDEVIGVDDFTEEYNYAQALHVEKGHGLTCFFHDNVKQDMTQASNLLFLPNEKEAINYFVKDVMELKKLSSSFKIIALKEKAKDSKEIQDFLEFSSQKGLATGEGLVYAYIEYSREVGNRNVLDAVNETFESGEEIDSQDKYEYKHFGPKRLNDAHNLGVRVFTRIVDIFSTRIGYLINQIQAGDERFKERQDDYYKNSGGTRKGFDVDPNYQFTEIDAQKAAELNLPWSKLEQEMIEENQ